MNEGEVTLLFYTTAGCHLCEEAALLLQELAQERQADERFVVEEVDISTDAALVEAYGIRIPVIKNAATSQELGWPFSLVDITKLLD